MKYLLMLLLIVSCCEKENKNQEIDDDYPDQQFPSPENGNGTDVPFND